MVTTASGRYWPTGTLERLTEEDEFGMMVLSEADIRAPGAAFRYGERDPMFAKSKEKSWRLPLLRELARRRGPARSRKVRLALQIAEPFHSRISLV
jgi:hypothetical protein